MWLRACTRPNPERWYQPTRSVSDPDWLHYYQVVSCTWSNGFLEGILNRNWRMGCRVHLRRDVARQAHIPRLRRGRAGRDDHQDARQGSVGTIRNNVKQWQTWYRREHPRPFENSNHGLAFRKPQSHGSWSAQEDACRRSYQAYYGQGSVGTPLSVRVPRPGGWTRNW